MTKIIPIESHQPKDSTVAVLNREDESLKAFLSNETTPSRYSFTQIKEQLQLLTAQEADRIVEELNSEFESTGIRTFNEVTKQWMITPMEDIVFVAAAVEFEE
jgi:hypothetical protein